MESYLTQTFTRLHKATCVLLPLQILWWRKKQEKRMVIRAAAFVLTFWATVGFSFCHAQAVICPKKKLPVMYVLNV
jgi:hypothetical protein